MNGHEHAPKGREGESHGALPLAAVDALLDILEEQLAQYRLIAALLERQRDALVGRDVKVLDEVNGQLARVADTVRALEAERLRQANDIAKAAGVDAEAVTAQWLNERLDVARSERLRRAAAELVQELRSVQGLQQLNADLAQRGLRYVSETVRLLAKALEPAYQPPGPMRAGPSAKAAGSLWFDGQA
jgi:hypothetical protein